MGTQEQFMVRGYVTLFFVSHNDAPYKAIGRITSVKMFLVDFQLRPVHK